MNVSRIFKLRLNAVLVPKNARSNELRIECTYCHWQQVLQRTEAQPLISFELEIDGYVASTSRGLMKKLSRLEVGERI